MPRQTLPLFPLPLVLFPGSTIPLHIFEPRYRRLLTDCVEGDRRFGLVMLPPGIPELALPRGQVGTLARIDSVEALDDGRSNIVVTGTDRFAFERFVESERPYHVAEVGGFDDFPEPDPALASEAAELVEQFARVALAARQLADDAAPPPELPDDPAAVSFAIAAVIDLGAEARQRILAERSPLARVRQLAGILAAAALPLERRAEVHVRARSNGRGSVHPS